MSTLSGRSRHMLDALPRGNVDEIVGMSPVISVPQKRPAPSASSIVATMTEVLDYLRLIYSRFGTVHCPDCHVPVQAQSPEQIVEQISGFPERTKVQLLAPLVRDRKGEHRDLFERMSREGFVRTRIDGEILEISESPPLDKNKKHSIEVVVDRLIIKPDIHQRLADSIEQVLRLSEGACLALIDQKGEVSEQLFHRDLNCPSCNRSFLPLESRSFSWHSPHGACPTCEGTGQIKDKTCHDCHGERLNSVSRHVQVQGTTLPDLLKNSITRSIDWVEEFASSQQNGKQSVQMSLCDPLKHRLQTLVDLGIGYLSLNRTTDTLAGGEIQRLRLARCLGTQLQGSCFILDEPTAGLHPRDAAQLISILVDLTKAGNTVVCVEHHLDAIRAAEHLIEIGPGGGIHGGEILFSGSPADLSKHHLTSTARALKGEFEKTLLKKTDSASNSGTIQLEEVGLHNLKNVSLELPLDKLIAVSGVSGSGKSSLILDALTPLLKEAISNEKSSVHQRGLGKLTINGTIRKLQVVDQSPPGTSARSCPATYSGVWEEIRRLLAKTRLAKIRGFSEKRFTFNSAAGTCERCQGLGEIRLKMPLLPQTEVVCPECRGKRFNAQTLAVKYRGHSPYDLLEMTIEEALEFWSEVTSISTGLKPLVEIGLGYLKMGQPASTLSGGEAQRVKLAKAMCEEFSEGLFILDEPTSGLHWADVSLFIQALRTIQAAGNSIIVVEHHPLMLYAADWHLELGPGAGELGGQILKNGPA
ncbi:hypothetical protein [uncultured Rubinisphaera sp.]|uniref:hypothetical protein n=1 Tax=uncultured Rubinisphaera sp. TaxID=1678686 RepID=UPI0030DD3172